MLLSKEFFEDKNVKNAIKQILNRLEFYQSSLKQVKPTIPELKTDFAKLINIIESCKGPLYYPYLSAGLGNGPYVECADGSVKLDFISGIGVHWSHGDRKIIESSLKSALYDTVMQGNLQQHVGSVELYKILCDLSGLDYAFLTSSGVMGVENALKICFQYKAPANRILAFSKNFCGRTLAAASITDKPKNRDGLPVMLNVDYIPFYDPEKPIESTEISLQHLNTYLSRFPHQHACMKFELIQGEGGFNVGSRRFFKKLISVLKTHDIPVYVDETQTFGRTSSLFAFQLFDLQDDIDVVSIGKLSQVCATMYRKKLKPRPGLISQTFTSSTGAIEASKIIISELVNNNYLGKTGKIAKLHGYFARRFRQLEKKTSGELSDLRGVGSMIAFKIRDGNHEFVSKFIKKCFSNGLISFFAGNRPTYVRFLLPIGGVLLSHIDEALDIVEKTLEEIK